jgi:DNA uptake protein ComE-like DNA-binding protein
VAEPTQALPTETVASDAATAEPTVESQATESAATTEPAVAVVTKLNLNTATDEELLTVPNTGQRMLREFKEYRPYDSILQFRREIGKYVDEAQVAEYEKYLYVPVSPNNADAATLQQLPGVDQAIADQLIVARPYATSDDFVKKLAELVTPEQLAAGQTYVEAAE